MTSYNRYSHHARRALTHSSLLVTRYRHPGMDTGHLLVGVMLTDGSIGSQALKDLNLDIVHAEVHLKHLLPSLPKPPEVVVNLDSLNEALALATDEANWLGHHYIGTEHLLLGMTRTNLGNASDLLRLLDIPAEQVRRRVRRALSDGLTEASLQTARRNVRLSELSRRVLNAAEQISVEHDHPTVGLGHLLLILLMEKRSPTSVLLKGIGLDEARLRLGLEKHEAPLMVSLEPVIDMALDFAERLGDHYTGTEHLLLALSIDPAGTALLQQFGLKPDEVRRRVENKLRGQR